MPRGVFHRKLRQPPHAPCRCACGDHVFQPINRACVILLSPKDVDLLARIWTAARQRSGRYVARFSQHFRKANGKRAVRSIYLHHLVLETDCGVLRDHRNRNPLDNRRSNLRAANNLENARNASARKVTSRFKGVGRKNNKWTARITIKQQLVFLGSFTEELDAAHAYDQAALRYFGAFAALNFPIDNIPREHVRAA